MRRAFLGVGVVGGWTWLDGSISSASLTISGYHIFRCDRSTGRGGGVAFYVSSLFAPRVLDSGVEGSLEYLTISIPCSQTPIIVSVCYYPPPVSTVDPLANHVDSLLRHSCFFLLGDFNINLLRDYPLARMLRDLLYTSNLSYLPFSSTRLGSLLDLFILPEDCSAGVVSFGQRTLPGISDHDLIFATFHLMPPKRGNEYRNIRSLKRVDVPALREAAKLCNWSMLEGQALM